MSRKALSNVGERLRHARQLAGISARRLDGLAGTTPGHVSLLESGTRLNLETRTAAKFTCALGISLDWLVNGEGEAPSAVDVAKAVERAGRKLAKAS